MTLVCVPIMVEEVDSALRDAALAKDAGADIVEFRIDALFQGEGDSDGEAGSLRLCAESPLPSIVTCRDASEGGDYRGDDAAKIALYERLGTSDRPPAYIDLELALWRRSANLRQKVLLAVAHEGQVRSDVTTRLILSAHDFDGRPKDLLRIVGEMREVKEAAVLKIAYRARSLRDNLELFDLLSERDRPMIALAMGEFGLMSRVLAPKFGGFLTFASLRDESSTAPGQPTIDELLHLYRFRSIGKQTKVYGVIGWPLGHSMSPLVHNVGFEQIGWDGVYLPLPVAPEWEPLKATLHALVDHRAIGFNGASVTIPHKQNALRFATESEWGIGAVARSAGALNTIALPPEGWTGANTDGPAIAQPLSAALGGLPEKRIHILGAGGAARAAVAMLKMTGATLTVHNRTRDNASALAEEFGVALGGWPASCNDACNAVVNCTPIGMTGGPAPDDSPVPIETLKSLDTSTIIFDTVYNPIETPLLHDARACNLRTVDGVEMFVAQAEAQFQMWTGQAPPAGLFNRLVRDQLKN